MPQGSVLRLNSKIQVTTRRALIGYADDLALIVTCIHMSMPEKILKLGIVKIDHWMEQNGLELATEKTDLLILAIELVGNLRL